MKKTYSNNIAIKTKKVEEFVTIHFLCVKSIHHEDTTLATTLRANILVHVAATRPTTLLNRKQNISNFKQKMKRNELHNSTR